MYTVIIIDDNPTAVRAIEKTTHWDMFECRVVGTASNGVEGIKLIQEKQPDIVITDIRMPGYDGLEMINLMQQAGIESSYIIISGYDDFAYARTALRLGVFDYLLKPVRTKDLERSLSNLLLRLDDAFESPVEEDSVHKQIQRIRSKRDSYSLLVQNAVRSIDLFD